MAWIGATRSNGVRWLALGLAAFALSSARARAEDSPTPTVAKDSVRVTATTFDTVTKGGKRVPGASWLPAIEFRVNGPIPNGSLITVDFAFPGGNKPWLKYDCFDVVRDVDAGSWWKTACGALRTDRLASVKEEQAATMTGAVSFVIKMKNEMAGTKATLFSGKAKISKYLTRPKMPDSTEFYVDDDWRLPIAYVGFETGASKHMPGQTYKREDDSHVLVVAMELRGRSGDVKAGLFFQGKQLTQTLCRAGENSEWNPAKPAWSEVECKFSGVYKSEIPPGEGEDPRHLLAKNPGAYEVKLTNAGHLARTLKLAVAADGGVDDGVAAKNKLGSGRAVVPVQLVGDNGAWDKTAWKADAFYGNPLVGFSAAP